MAAEGLAASLTILSPQKSQNNHIIKVRTSLPFISIKPAREKPSNHVVAYFTMAQTCSSESQSDKRSLSKAISQQPMKPKRMFKPEKDSQQGTLGRKIPQLDKKTQLQIALRRKQHESKQKTEEIKSKLEKYSSKLKDNGNSHVKAQIEQICKAVNSLSEVRDKQFGKRPFLLGTIQLKRYQMLDDALLAQKKITLQNIINKSQGLPLKKSRIKMIEIYNSDIIPNQLKDLQKKTSITSMDKLQLLMKTECGWIAIVKNKETGMFMVDVSLIDEQGWKVITQLTAP